MRPCAIPPELWPEVQRLARGGSAKEPLTPQQIVEWLAKEHKVTCSHMAVRRLLERLQDPARFDPETLTPPKPKVLAEPPATKLEPPTDEESLEHIRRLAYREIKQADDWKQKHSAMRIAIAADQALDKKRLFEAEFGDGAGSRALTSDEEAAALEAARQTFVSIYELQDPSTLPAPGPGAPLDDGGRPLAN